MGWASAAIETLLSGNRVTIKPRGNSMVPLIKSGQEVVIYPIAETSEPKVGDIVLVKCNGNVYLHLVKAKRLNDYGSYFQIGNNKNKINGWVGRNSIYGIACKY